MVTDTVARPHHMLIANNTRCNNHTCKGKILLCNLWFSGIAEYWKYDTMRYTLVSCMYDYQTEKNATPKGVDTLQKNVIM